MWVCGVASGMNSLGSLELECEPNVHAGQYRRGSGFGRVATAAAQAERKRGHQADKQLTGLASPSPPHSLTLLTPFRYSNYPSVPGRACRVVPSFVPRVSANETNTLVRRSSFVFFHEKIETNIRTLFLSIKKKKKVLFQI